MMNDFDLVTLDRAVEPDQLGSLALGADAFGGVARDADLRVPQGRSGVVVVVAHREQAIDLAPHFVDQWLRAGVGMGADPLEVARAPLVVDLAQELTRRDARRVRARDRRQPAGDDRRGAPGSGNGIARERKQLDIASAGSGPGPRTGPGSARSRPRSPARSGTERRHPGRIAAIRRRMRGAVGMCIRPPRDMCAAGSRAQFGASCDDHYRFHAVRLHDVIVVLGIGPAVLVSRPLNPPPLNEETIRRKRVRHDVGRQLELGWWPAPPLHVPDGE